MGSMDASPTPSEEHRATRPLSTLAAIGIAGTTAAIVFSSGVYLVERGGARVQSAAPRPPTEAVAATSGDAGPGPQAGSIPRVEGTGATRGAATAEVEPSPDAEISATPWTGAPEGRALPSGPPAAAPAASTPPAPRKGHGTLQLTSARDATVYLTGVAVGRSNRPLEVRCGRFFVRLGEPTPDGTRWLGEGRTVVIRCGALTEVSF
jgi:hypothetical protein